MKRKYNKAKPSTNSLKENELIQAFWNNFSESSDTNNLMAQRTVVRTRLSEYLWRADAGKDGLIRSIVSAHYVNALGIEDRNRPNISVHVGRENRKELPEPLVNFLDAEAEKVVTMLNQKLSFLAKDALVFGDGYASARGEFGKGITDIIYSLGSKPWSVTPYKSNFHNDDVGYAIQAPRGQKGRSLNNPMPTQNSMFIRSYAYIAKEEKQKTFVIRLDLGDGTLEAQDYTDRYVDAYNPFSTEETYYQDSIHSGLLEGQKEKYDKYKGSIEASYSKKIASSIIERFITISMNHTSVKERDVLKKEIAKMMVAADSHRRKKVDNQDASASVVHHIVPTTGDNATGAFEMNESSLEFKDDMEDVMFHAKALIGAMKFHPQYTAFSDNTEGERQEDSVARTSEQMEEVGGNLRSSVSDTYINALSIHFHLLGYKDIDPTVWEVEYNAVTVQSKKEQEYDRVDNLNNQAQFNDVALNLKDLITEDTPDNRALMRDILVDSVPLNITNKEEFLDRLINVVMTQPKEEDGDE